MCPGAANNSTRSVRVLAEPHTCLQLCVPSSSRYSIQTFPRETGTVHGGRRVFRRARPAAALALRRDPTRPVRIPESRSVLMGRRRFRPLPRMMEDVEVWRTHKSTPLGVANRGGHKSTGLLALTTSLMVGAAALGNGPSASGCMSEAQRLRKEGSGVAAAMHSWDTNEARSGKDRASARATGAWRT